MTRSACASVVMLFLLASALAASAQTTRPRARALGIAPGVFEPGPLNAITDVDGVRVGHVTLVEGDRVRTGVTAILPHGDSLFRQKVPGAVFVGNAFGKLAGSTQVDELGTIETPVVLTNTLGVGAAVDGVVRWTLARPGNADVRSVNALVGETNDGRLNDIRAQPLKPDHVVSAIDAAAGGEVAEGNVGAGTGTVAFGWKGGIGTSSRRLPARWGGYTLGVLVQANYGGVLTIDGQPVGKALGRHPFADRVAMADEREAGPGQALLAPGQHVHLQDLTPGTAAETADGSCLIVVATDAPLDARDLKRLAARAVFALARTGSSYSNGSGDYAVAFSTAPSMRVAHGATTPAARSPLPTDGLSPLFQAVLEATEEAVYNALFAAETMSGNGTTVDALPLDRVRELLRR